MSSTVLVLVLDNNYLPKSRSAFISVLLHMLASSCLRLMFVFAYYLHFFENFRKLLSRSGTRALRDNNYPNKWRPPFLTRYFLSFFFLPSFPFVPSSRPAFPSLNETESQRKEGSARGREGRRGGQTERRSKREERKGFKARKGQND